MPTNLITIISISSVIIVGLIGLIWKNLSNRVDAKIDRREYVETMKHIQKAVDGINGTAAALKHLAEEITKIQEKFMLVKDFEYEMKLHKSECHKDEK